MKRAGLLRALFYTVLPAFPHDSSGEHVNPCRRRIVGFDPGAWESILHTGR
jgi:hypothetical protein